MINGINGYRLPITADAVEFADKIHFIIQTPGMLDSLKAGARNLYDKEFNWNIFGEKLRNIIDSYP